MWNFLLHVLFCSLSSLLEFSRMKLINHQPSSAVCRILAPEIFSVPPSFLEQKLIYHDSYQRKFQADPFPLGNVSILCVHIGRKGNKGRERALNTEHTGSRVIAVADSCQYLQKRLQQIFD